MYFYTLSVRRLISNLFSIDEFVILSFLLEKFETKNIFLNDYCSFLH